MRKLLTTPRFDKRLHLFLRHHSELTPVVEKIMNYLASDKYPVNLKIHKLNGILQGSMAANISYEYRIIFVVNAEKICFIDIGNHDEVYR